MKLAIFGSSPIALEAALRFHVHGASLTWFNGDEFSAPLYRSACMSWESCTSELGHELLKETGLRPFERSPFTWEKWFNHYYNPLIEVLKIEQSIKPYKPISVTKRFLGQGEEIPGKSRFYDLFRVIYQLNPEEFINQQKETNPETYQRLSEEFVQSLQSSLEMYEDFDLVFDLRELQKPSSVAQSGRALGEGRIKDEKLSQGLEALVRSYQVKAHSDLREICLVGSGALALDIFLNLEHWIKEERSRLFIVSAEEDPFASVLSRARPEVKEHFHKIIDMVESEFKGHVDEFHRKLRDWQNLDDFVQVKVPKPAEPIPRLVFFSGHNVTALDQLIDKRRLFVTLERPDFREGRKQPENNQLELKTIGVDEVLSANELQRWPVREFLQQNETGYFEIAPKSPHEINGWKEDLDELDAIEEIIFKLFTPAGGEL